MQTKVCVTGCGGYIGTVLCEKLLQNGYRVDGIDNLMYRQSAALIPLLRHRKFSFHQTDIVNSSAWIKIASRSDVIIHLAALVGAPLCDKNPALSKATNSTAVKDLTKCLRNQLLIFPNTNSGYGSQPGLCSETSKLEPLSFYAQHKCEAEEFVKAYNHSVIFRLATVYGLSPRMRLDLMVNDFTYQCFFQRKLEIFEPQFARNFIHVDDVADAFIFAIEHGFQMQGEIYNLGDEMNMTKAQLAGRICILTGAKYSERAGTDPDRRNYRVSNVKLYTAGFCPSQNFQNGVVAMIGWMQTLPKSKRQRDQLLRNMRNA